MPAKLIDCMPIQTRKRTQDNPIPEKGKPLTPETPKGWSTGLPFFDVSKWSFWATKDEEPKDTETKPAQEETSDAGTLDPAMQVYPAEVLRQSHDDKEPVKNELISAPIEAFGEVPNMFSRPSSPSNSLYENTFDINRDDDLDSVMKADVARAENGMTDEQFANYQHCFQSMEGLETHQKSESSSKVKGKQPTT